MIKRLPKAFVDHLERECVLQLGKHYKFSRALMIEKLKCGNFIAAKRLTKALKKLRIRSPHELYALDPDSLWRMKGVGITQVFVAMCVLEAFDFDVSKWMGWSVPAKQEKHEVSNG
jgi:hypothetical protein